ncbi:TadE/TadG family type IV pilus assembly protein [Nocardioides sp. Kera G14]|uniref:TadE/TadG family type IV pilus assembly protein n=1 Tax=Nocardioides sp. Kera G14 TaxID=2884264 RepID=UPI001D129594|nr:TadE/TadG family type IV pilus assembly protein [Nocardioides sp. Kera G14]UDY22809.1 pilus assembly protein [Nocardioides sp. Kera G14]
MNRRRRQRGAAVVDFVLILLLLVPLFLGILQVSLVLFVRNTLASAAAEGARFAATADHALPDGVNRTRQQLQGVVSERFADDIRVTTVMIDGAPAVEVTVHATVPALGIGGPGVALTVTGHAIKETP